jgi:hypothetical protein
MHKFETKRLPIQRDVIAPDGSDVRILLGLQGGGMARKSGSFFRAGVRCGV